MTADVATRPFPFEALDLVTRAELAGAARLRRVARDAVRTEALEGALSELVDEPVAIRVERIRPFDGARGTDDSIGVLVAPAGSRAPSRRVLIEVEGALGAGITARALRQRAPRITDPARIPSAALCGAFAAVLVAALRRAHAGSARKVIAAGPGSALAADLATGERDATTVWLTVTLGGEAFEARVSVPDAASVTTSGTSFARAELLAMGEAPLALPIVIATTLASRADLEALAPGDAFVPAASRTAVHAGGEVLGAVSLVAPRGERGLAAEIATGGLLVVRGRLESHPWEPEMSSDERESTATTVALALEDAPVVVRVELGTVEMTAREWAELGPGDVVALGRKIGDLAILRVGGVELARGELVQLEGEMAVRIASRAKSNGGERR